MAEEWLIGPMMPKQCRAARAWLDWSQEELATKAKVSLSTVRGFEEGRCEPIANNLEAIRAALEKAGISFVYSGSAPGISFLNRKRR
jgi:ribosome-binding protein aMBF1 (putative translation factor)